MDYYYEKLDEDMNIERCPMDDKDGSITGKIIIGLQRYFDENPEERIRLGWIKHIVPDRKEVEYNPQTQFILTTQQQIDPYTITDVYHVRNKSEDQLLFEEMLSVAMGSSGSGIVFYG